MPFDVLLTHPDKLAHISPPIKASRPADALAQMRNVVLTRPPMPPLLLDLGGRRRRPIMCSCDVAPPLLELLTAESSRCTRSSRDNLERSSACRSCGGCESSPCCTEQVVRDANAVEDSAADTLEAIAGVEPYSSVTNLKKKFI